MPLHAASNRLPVLVQDAVLALFITYVQVAGVVRVTASSEVAGRPIDDLGHLGLTLLLVSGAALVVRRRWPVAVAVVEAGVSALYFGLEFHDGPVWLSLFVALYTLTAYGDGRRSIQVAAGLIAGLSVVWVVTGADVEPREALGWLLFRIGASIMSAALGESVRSRRVIAAEAVERAERAELTREMEAQARVDAERLRIAREVHDTVAHAIAIINVQAGITAHVLDKRPERAREALETIEHTSSRALEEMRTVLGVLRSDDDPRSPQPGLDQVAELTAKARQAGLDIELDGPGAPPAPVPTAVGSATYRIVQESLTNVIRHAGPTRVRVSLDYDDDALVVRVVDAGGAVRSADAQHGRAGHGIAGMRERCRMLGGDLAAGETPGGGFQVTARLPLAASEVPA
jgi:signal transduction histidine kinase